MPFIWLIPEVGAGIEPLKIGGHRYETEKTPEKLVDFRREAPVFSHAPIGEGLRHTAEGRIRLLVKRIAYEQVSGDA